MPRLVNRRPGRGGALLLAALPFLLLVAVYLTASHLRLAANPDDKLLPSVASFGAAIARVAIEPDARTGDVLLWADSAASLRTLAVALLLASLIGLVTGVMTGAIPLINATLSRFIATLSLVPPLTVLPILFIVFGLGEVARIALILFGVTPVLIRDLGARIAELPSEQFVKAQTLGASSWQLIARVVVPQVLPRLVDALRLSLGAAWLFLIAAEAIAADQGLGYRIFLVRRYLAMDVILPYVAWITLLAFTFDRVLLAASRMLFPWYHLEKQAM